MSYRNRSSRHGSGCPHARTLQAHAAEGYPIAWAMRSVFIEHWPPFGASGPTDVVPIRLAVPHSFVWGCSARIAQWNFPLGVPSWPSLERAGKQTNNSLAPWAFGLAPPPPFVGSPCISIEEHHGSLTRTMMPWIRLIRCNGAVAAKPSPANALTCAIRTPNGEQTPSAHGDRPRHELADNRHCRQPQGGAKLSPPNPKLSLLIVFTARVGRWLRGPHLGDGNLRPALVFGTLGPSPMAIKGRGGEPPITSSTGPSINRWRAPTRRRPPATVSPADEVQALVCCAGFSLCVGSMNAG